MSYLKLEKIIDKNHNIVFFGGAGVSTESNIPDFRSENGLYNTKYRFKYSPEVMLNYRFFIEHTEEFYKFYKERVLFPNASPNNAHLALARLEASGKLKGVITQNIDGLHQKAGSKNVQELHGSVHRNYCTKCNKHYDLNYIINSPNIIPYCNECNSLVKPDVVLYEEALDNEIIKMQ
ncbi:NAD-dependent protein deacylase [Hathewaya histolytica]|uniref:protein acetyllysine N-acetyltransferase n=1 Tax=Hathewaya histolytica TaxID=1498 RepID=A0A4U9QV96_HATHI|nr:NAD-dependent deacetylase [Hathewaya histolytica]